MVSHQFSELEIASEVYGFDALRGIQAGREFYVAMCPLKIIPKLFIYNEYELSPEIRAQRTLQESRIPQMAAYIVSNSDNYIFSSLTASVDGEMRFVASPSVGEKGKLGRLYIAMDSRILINDGQHRRAAIESALKEKPELGNESISVVFFSDAGLKKSQQMFSDLNKNAVKPTRSLAILYDHRDEFSRFIVNLVNTVPTFHGRVELERSTISNRSTKFFTLNGVSIATSELLKPKSRKVTEEQQKLAQQYWEEVAINIPEWQLLMDKKVAAGELRKEYVHSHTNFLHALGIMGYILIKQHPNDWKAKLKGLQQIDWLRSNPQWEGKLTIKGVMIKNKLGINLAANIFLKACDVKLPPEREVYENQKITR